MATTTFRAGYYFPSRIGDILEDIFTLTRLREGQRSPLAANETLTVYIPVSTVNGREVVHALIDPKNLLESLVARVLLFKARNSILEVDAHEQFPTIVRLFVDEDSRPIATQMARWCPDNVGVCSEALDGGYVGSALTPAEVRKVIEAGNRKPVTFHWLLGTALWRTID